jgi:hypothetical protein
MVHLARVEAAGSVQAIRGGALGLCFSPGRENGAVLVAHRLLRRGCQVLLVLDGVIEALVEIPHGTEAFWWDVGPVQRIGPLTVRRGRRGCCIRRFRPLVVGGAGHGGGSRFGVGGFRATCGGATARRCIGRCSGAYSKNAVTVQVH